ncbi:MAG: hypothetical protein ACLFVE_15980 [Chitinispirillaceae bacterium]
MLRAPLAAKGTIPPQTIFEQLRRNCRYPGGDFIPVPALRLLREEDLIRYREKLEAIVGHYGPEAKMLSDMLRCAGDEKMNMCGSTLFRLNESVIT